MLAPGSRAEAFGHTCTRVKVRVRAAESGIVPIAIISIAGDYFLTEKSVPYAATVIIIM